MYHQVMLQYFFTKTPKYWIVGGDVELGQRPHGTHPAA
jgi:hypothetical protein